MADAIAQVGTFLSSPGGKELLQGGVSGGGLLQNFMANREAQNKQKFVEQLITSPAKFSAYVNGFEKPLQAGLTADIQRQTDAYGGERGLGSSPAIMKDVLAQALAPAYQNQQQQAQQAALQSLGIYENSPTTKPVDVSSLLKALMGGQQQQPNVTAGINPGSVPGLGGQDLMSIVGTPPSPLPSPLVGDTGDMP